MSEKKCTEEKDIESSKDIVIDGFKNVSHEKNSRDGIYLYVKKDMTISIWNC